MEEYFKIKELLDSDYFHICIKLCNPSKWTIFYKNLSTEEYFSEINKPLLDSEKNTIYDVEILANKFENEKRKELQILFKSDLENMFLIHNQMFKLKEKCVDISIFSFMQLIIFTCANMIFNSDFKISLLVFIMNIISMIYHFWKLNNIDKNIKKAKEEFTRILLKEHIKQLGIKFVERIV